MSTPELTRAAIEKILHEFPDPETGRSLVSLGQLKDVELDGDRLNLTVGLTSFSAALWDSIRSELADFVRSRLPQLQQVEVQVVPHERPAEKLGVVGVPAKAVIAVGSGKGGVGKSTVAALMAYGLSAFGSKVGLMDADVFGPSIPHLIGSEGEPVLRSGRIQPVVVDGITVMSMGFLVPAGEAVIWRGPMLHNALTQFLRDTDWGELDYLIVDMPPGTGDVAISLSQLVPVTGAVVVCTPQDVALLDATKAVTMFRRVNIDVLGMVENMSHFVCPNCQTRHEIFSSGGARQRAQELDVPFLGELPINIQIRVLGDLGKTRSCLEELSIRPYVDGLCQRLVRNIVNRRRRSPVLPSLTVL